MKFLHTNCVKQIEVYRLHRKYIDVCRWQMDCIFKCFGSQWFKACPYLSVRDAVRRGGCGPLRSPVRGSEEVGGHSTGQFHSLVPSDTLTGIGGGLCWVELRGHGETHFSRDSKGASVGG